MCMGVGLSTGAWAVSKGPYHWRKLTLSPPGKHQLPMASQKGEKFVETLPHPFLDLGWLGPVHEVTVMVVHMYNYCHV